MNRVIEKMINIFDVAKYILEKLGPMSTWKLQKLCYYAQAWTLAWEDRPLFPEDFQAWRNGPVCPELFQEHKGKYFISAEDLKKGKAENVTGDDKENVDLVLAEYGDKEPWWLREQTHSEDPWKNARGDFAPFENSDQVIDKSAIGEYYASL